MEKGSCKRANRLTPREIRACNSNLPRYIKLRTVIGYLLSSLGADRKLILIYIIAYPETITRIKSCLPRLYKTTRINLKLACEGLDTRERIAIDSITRDSRGLNQAAMQHLVTGGKSNISTIKIGHYPSMIC